MIRKLLNLELYWQILIGVVLGILYGLFLSDYVEYVSWMGTVFLRALKMLIAPLILSSMIAGISNIGSAKSLGRLGLKTFGWYIMTGMLSIPTGLVLVNLLQPGKFVDLSVGETASTIDLAKKPFSETLIEIIPSNIFTALNDDKTLSIIFFAILCGYFIMHLQDEYKKTLTVFFTSVFELMLKLTMFVVRFAPLGLLGIIAKVVGEQANNSDQLLKIATSLGMYSLTILIGLSIHAFVYLPLIMRVIGKINPLKYAKAMSTPLLTAFSTSSSNATLALTMEAAENNAGISNKTTSFVLPIGASLNTDGTALYECVAAIFIAQAYGIELTFADQIIVIFTTLLASLGAAGIPMSGLVMLTVILTTVGLPLEGISLILAVDRILDMFRTCVNVWSDCGCVAVVARTEGEELKV